MGHQWNRPADDTDDYRCEYDFFQLTMRLFVREELECISSNFLQLSAIPPPPQQMRGYRFEGMHAILCMSCKYGKQMALSWRPSRKTTGGYDHSCSFCLVTKLVSHQQTNGSYVSQHNLRNWPRSVYQPESKITFQALYLIESVQPEMVLG